MTPPLVPANWTVDVLMTRRGWAFNAVMSDRRGRLHVVEQPPRKSSAREVTEHVVEGAAGMVPFAGGGLAVAFAYAMGYAYKKRMQNWFDQVAEKLNEHEERLGGLSFEGLADDEAFVDSLVTATRAAQATSSQEKLDALRNGLVNSLAPDAPLLDERLRFFRLIEQFTPAHLRLLAFLDDPGSFFETAGIPRPNLIGGAKAALLAELPEFALPGDWLGLCFGDLSAASLVVIRSLGAMQTGPSLYDSVTSELGKRFLAFVRDPRA
jgi:hypothetical protein